MRPKNQLLQTHPEHSFAQCSRAREKFFDFFHPVAEGALGEPHFAPRLAAQDGARKGAFLLPEAAKRRVDAVLLPAAVALVVQRGKDALRRVERGRRRDAPTDVRIAKNADLRIPLRSL